MSNSNAVVLGGREECLTDGKNCERKNETIVSEKPNIESVNMENISGLGDCMTLPTGSNQAIVMQKEIKVNADLVKKKTKPCRFFGTRQGCRDGELCRFSHVPLEDKKVNKKNRKRKSGNILVLPSLSSKDTEQISTEKNSLLLIVSPQSVDGSGSTSQEALEQSSVTSTTLQTNTTSTVKKGRNKSLKGSRHIVKTTPPGYSEQQHGVIVISENDEKSQLGKQEKMVEGEANIVTETTGVESRAKSSMEKMSMQGNIGAKTNKMRQKCRFFSRGRCTAGVECQFVHAITEKGKTDDVKSPSQTNSSAKRNTRKTKNSTASNHPPPCMDPSTSHQSPKVPKAIPNSVPPRGPPVARPLVGLEGVDLTKPDDWTAEDMAKMQQIEMEQMRKLYRMAGFRLISESPVTMAMIMNPSSPDWPYEDLRDIMLKVTLLPTYPRVPCSVAITNSNIPEAMRYFLNQQIAKYLTTNHSTWCQGSPLMIRPFVKWLDRNLEALILNSGREYKHQLAMEQSGIQMIRHDNILVASDPLTSPVDVANDDTVDVNHDITNDDDDDDDEGEEEEEEENEDAESAKAGQASQAPGGGNRPTRGGTEISFPGLTIGGVGVIKMAKLLMVVACERCKTRHDVGLRVRSDAVGLDTVQATWTGGCSKCNGGMGVEYHSNMMHEADNVPGWLSLTECVPFDIILEDSMFWVACFECGEARENVGVVSRGVKKEWNCARCHAKIMMLVDAVKFRRVRPTLTHSAMVIPTQAQKKNKSQNLGLKLGTPLPNMGSCKHYRRSHRWLRFPCCGRVYPCDICHEVGTNGDHEMRWANRMVCGFCSLEQSYSGKPCRCGSVLAGGGGRSFWEGGHGCRSKMAMNKNDSKKHSGSSKTVSKRSIRRTAK